MQAKTRNRRARNQSIWPQDNDQERVVENKPASIPHFLCRSQKDASSAPAGVAADNQNRPAVQEDHWTRDNTPPVDKPATAKKFTPVSPHLHRMMMQRRTELPQRHEPPSWVQETFQEHNAAERQRVYKGLAIAACLVLASGIGLTVTAMEFKSSGETPAVWNNSLAALLPTMDTSTKPLKSPPVIGAPTTAKPTVATATGQVKILTKIGSVKLTVEDASGAAKAPIALPVAAESGQGEPPIAVRLTGLPAEAELSAGARQQDASWLLRPADLTDLKLTVSEVPAKPLKVTVAAIETETGELAAPMQEMTIKVDPSAVVIEPAALPVTNSQNFSSEVAASKTHYAANKQAVAMRKRGDETLALGDVAGARGFYKKALKMGDVASAARIGRTYDPVVYQAVGVHGLKPDPLMAERWYKHAISEGDAGARDDLKRLTQRVVQ